MSKWISVNKRLPEVNRFVLAYTSYDRTVITWIDSGTKRFDIMEIDYDGGERFTHWMLLPPPPKVEKER